MEIVLQLLRKRRRIPKKLLKIAGSAFCSVMFRFFDGDGDAATFVSRQEKTKYTHYIIKTEKILPSWAKLEYTSELDS